ncbi:MAG: acyl-CoA dehydrogenase family protein [Myxococcota bacterium]
MALLLTEEQELLRETAREFVRERAPVTELRKLRDEASPDGFSRELWKDMVELGWSGIIFPEDVGGVDLGHVELGVVLEETGRTLMASPLVSTVLLAGNAVLLGGNDVQRKDVLTAVCAGERVLALALQEGGRHDPYGIATRAEETSGGYTLTGRKTFVLDGHVADQLVVAARTSGEVGERDGLTLFLVAAAADGLEITRTIMVDSRNAAIVELQRVEVERSAVLGSVDAGADVLDATLDRATAAFSAELLGTCLEAYERTLQYLKDRKQFGVPIGSFQALKHRAAQMFVEAELSRSIVLDALQAVDEKRPELPQLASVAKARVSDAAFLIGNEALQMHGGIGMTDEEEIGFFLKRARVAQSTLGDASFHRDRYATLQGF